MGKGIDKINLVTEFTIDFYIQTILVLEDKKVTLKESLGYIGTALKLPEIIKSLQELKLELLGFLSPKKPTNNHLRVFNPKTPHFILLL